MKLQVETPHGTRVSNEPWPTKERDGDLLYCHVALWYGIAQSPWHNQDTFRFHDMLPDLCFEQTTTCVRVVNLTFASGKFYRRGVSFLYGVVSKSVPLLLCVSRYHQAMRQFKTVILATRLVKSKPVYLWKQLGVQHLPFIALRFLGQTWIPTGVFLL